MTRNISLCQPNKWLVVSFVSSPALAPDSAPAPDLGGTRELTFLTEKLDAFWQNIPIKPARFLLLTNFI